jgi:RimK-like ATP-grasp domain
MRFFYVNDDAVPEITTKLLAEACAARDVEMAEVTTAGFLFDPESELAPGDMLYRSAITLAAMRVEQFLFSDRVAAFYDNPEAALGGLPNNPLMFQRAGVPVPRTIPLASGDRDLLRGHVRTLGGLPVIMKIPGGSGGIGTIRVDTLGGLFSLVDFLFDRGILPFLCAFIDKAVHWRAIVISKRVASAYRNVQADDDFRTYASEDAHDFTIAPPDAVADIAVRAVRALRLEFGGVDLLEHPSGRIYLLEANFPCFFAHPQTVAGVDVAGMMIEHLMGKSRALTL